MLCATEMTRIVWILIFVDLVAGGTAFLQDYPPNLGWLFGADDQQDVKQSKERPLCKTSDCVALAKMMTESMNPDVDPCENFYDYACGNWAKQNPLPEGEKVWSPLHKAAAVVEKRILDMLQAPTKPGDFLGLKMARKAYNACMDLDELERIGLDPLVITISRIGGWPLIMEENEWNDELYTWQYVDDYYAGLIGLNSLHQMTISTPWNWDSYELFLMVQEPFLPGGMLDLLGDYYEDDDDYESYDDYEDYEDDEGPNGSQERGSEERDYKDYEEDREKDDDEDTEEKRIIKGVKKRSRHDLKRYGDRKLSDKKHVGQRRMKRAATRSKVHHKVQHKRSRTKNRKVLRNKKAINKATHHRKISAHKRVKVHPRPNHSRKIKTDRSVKRYIYIDDDSAKDEEINDNRNRRYTDYYDYENDDEYSGSGGSGGGGDDEDEDDEDDGSGSGDGSYDDDEIEKKKKEKEERKKEMMELREKFKEYVLNVTMALVEATNVVIPQERIEKDINDLLEFQLKVAELFYLNYDMENSTVKELQEKYDDVKPLTKNGKIDWIMKLKNLGAVLGLEIDTNTEIVIPSYDYFVALRTLLDNTSSRTIVNYVHWYFISTTMKATTEQMAEFYYNWNKDEQRFKDRLEHCMEEFEMKTFLGYPYVKQYFSDDWKKSAMDMIDDIQKEVEYRVKESTWMDDPTREHILTKLVFMEKLIGYPPLYRNHTAMTNIFRRISFTNSHFENVMSLSRGVTRIQLFYANEETDDSYESYIDPLIVNAFYMPTMNTLEITAADFQSPLYNPNQPWYTNFGIIGFIMAHEVNHGFDIIGRLFDRHGEYASWLSRVANTAYRNRAKCFIQQFNRYSVEENRTANVQIKYYGLQTSSENIADSMGLEAVFGAYQRRQRNCEVPDPMLPGFENFTNNQMFFLSTANVWCAAYDPNKLEMYLKRDAHSLNPLRVIGTLSNSEDFAEAYHCPKGSPMNPEKKCNLWK